ncbi:MAG: hypothetical protein ABI856_04930, partial [Nitrospira sp.]
PLIHMQGRGVMLTRPNLFKFAATFGLGALAPRLDRSAHGAVPEPPQSRNLRSDSFFLTARKIAPGDGMARKPQG